MIKIGHFDQISYYIAKVQKSTYIFHFLPIFAKQIYKMHKIRSYYYAKRKILTKKFWSHGISLGYLGSGPRYQPATNSGTPWSSQKSKSAWSLV